ncbi:MAG: hypothetical protein WB919_01790, partial [Candidatus Sulfotelmatobacter sp.]
MSAPDNPQFDPQPLNTEPQLSAPVFTYISPPPAPKAGENPVWTGWDVLIIAALTLGTIFVVQLLIILAALKFAYPHQSWIDVAQKPVLALLSELVAYAVVVVYMFLLVEGKY